MLFADIDLEKGDRMETKRTTFSTFLALTRNTEGRVGYLIAWLLGVPSSLLLLIFLMRGH